MFVSITSQHALNPDFVFHANQFSLFNKKATAMEFFNYIYLE